MGKKRMGYGMDLYSVIGNKKKGSGRRKPIKKGIRGKRFMMPGDSKFEVCWDVGNMWGKKCLWPATKFGWSPPAPGLSSSATSSSSSDNSGSSSAPPAHIPKVCNIALTQNTCTAQDMVEWNERLPPKLWRHLKHSLHRPIVRRAGPSCWPQRWTDAVEEYSRCQAGSRSPLTHGCSSQSTEEVLLVCTVGHLSTTSRIIPCWSWQLIAA